MDSCKIGLCYKMTVRLVSPIKRYNMIFFAEYSEIGNLPKILPINCLIHNDCKISSKINLFY